MEASGDSGSISRIGARSVEETVVRLQALLQRRGIKLFALVDHSAEAAGVGMKMPPTKLLIFGNPRAGTPIMLAAPTSALDLPLKILVAEDEQGRTRISYNDPAYLSRRHGIPEDLMQALRGVAGVGGGGGELIYYEKSGK